MNNEQIPSELWKLKNEVVRLIESLAFSNTAHTDYKSNWQYLGTSLKYLGEEIHELAAKFDPPKHDE